KLTVHRTEAHERYRTWQMSRSTVHTVHGSKVWIRVKNCQIFLAISLMNLIGARLMAPRRLPHLPDGVTFSLKRGPKALPKHYGTMMASGLPTPSSAIHASHCWLPGFVPGPCLPRLRQSRTYCRIWYPQRSGAELPMTSPCDSFLKTRGIVSRVSAKRCQTSRYRCCCGGATPLVTHRIHNA